MAWFYLFLIGEEGQDVFSSLVKKTRGIIRGVGTHAVINASEKRIPIQMNHEQKLPRNIKANAMFSSAIGSFTRKHAPLIVKTWKKVSDKDKTSIITALTVSYFIYCYFNSLSIRLTSFSFS